jgi:hypothetical protein
MSCGGGAGTSSAGVSGTVFACARVHPAAESAHIEATAAPITTRGQAADRSSTRHNPQGMRISKVTPEAARW